MTRSIRIVVQDIAVKLAAFLVVATLALIVLHIVVRGLPLIDLDYLVSAPRQSGRSGGIAPFIVSTALVTLIALLVAVPTSIGIGMLIVEHLRPGSPMAKTTRACLSILAAVPSIVFGLVGNFLFCDLMGLGFSILSGGFTLSLMILPIIAYVVEGALRGQAESRRAAYALGLPRHKVALRVLLPAVAPSVLAGGALGFGRATAESAALIFTSGYVDRMPSSLFDSGRTLAVHILDLSMNIPGGDGPAFAAATVLLASSLGVVTLLAAIDRKFGEAGRIA